MALDAARTAFQSVLFGARERVHSREHCPTEFADLRAVTDRAVNNHITNPPQTRLHPGAGELDLMDLWGWLSMAL